MQEYKSLLGTNLPEGWLKTISKLPLIVTVPCTSLLVWELQNCSFVFGQAPYPLSLSLSLLFPPSLPLFLSLYPDLVICLLSMNAPILSPFISLDERFDLALATNAISC